MSLEWVERKHLPKAAQVVPGPTCTSRGRAGRVVLSTSATFPASCLWHQPVRGMLLVGLGKPCLCLENTIAGTVLQRGQPRPCSGQGHLVWGSQEYGRDLEPLGTWKTSHNCPCGALQPCLAFSSCFCREYGHFPAGSREEGHLEHRLFTFLSWLWAGHTIYKFFLFF